MTTKTIPPAPLTIEVVNTRAIEDTLTRTKGFLELIETVCNAATKNDAEEIGEVFSPYLVASLAMMCCFAAQDLTLMETLPRSRRSIFPPEPDRGTCPPDSGRCGGRTRCPNGV